MNSSNSRRDIGYTIVSRFEQSLRKLVGDKIRILFSNFREAVPQGIQDKITEKAKRIEFEDIYDFLEESDFPDLKEIVIYKSLYRYYFEPTGLLQSEFIKTMDYLYKIRCKIAHVSGIFTSMDIDELFAFTREITNAMEDHGTDLLTFLNNLENDPDKYIVPIPNDFICSPFIPSYCKVPNNIPTPDYELEGGFIGRDDDIRKVKNLLDGDLHRVVTITGAGGVGKTALALRVIQRILQNTTCNLDGIIWLSAKENKLSAFGIEEIEPSLKNYEGLLDSVLEVMGYSSIDQTIDQKEQDVQTIFDIHNRILLVVDNLETITDDRIIDFILDAHPKVKILITSRRGLGQVERRYELNQLKEKEAIALFRQVAIEKNLISLSKLDHDILGTYVRKVACFPLAIKWVIGHVALGKDINLIVDSALTDKSDIALFCFDHIYNSLSSRSKKLLCTLSVFEITPQAGVLQYVTNLSQEEFEESIQELVLVSLVIPDQSKTEDDKVITRFNLLSLTRGFVRNKLDHDSLLKSEIENRIRTVQTTVEEAERAKKQYKYSLFNLGATTEEEKIATLLAHTAYQKYQSGRYTEAVDEYKRAAGIAPRFASLYRNWAVMESNEGHHIEADTLMQKAVELSNNDAQLWLTWGNMKRKLDKIKEALEFYIKADELSPNNLVILNALGKTKCRLGDYESADLLFRNALNSDSMSVADSSVKHEIINRTSLADNLRRWAETLYQDRNYTEAEKKYIEALDHCKIALDLDPSDSRTKDLNRKLLLQLGHFYKRDNQFKSLEYFNKVIVHNPTRFDEARDTVRAIKEMVKIYVEVDDLDSVSSLFTPQIAKIAKRTDPTSFKEITSIISDTKREEAFYGKIISVNPEKGFCIIKSSNSIGDTYIGHVKSFLNKSIELDESCIDLNVTFFPAIDKNKNRKQAKAIKMSPK